MSSVLPAVVRGPFVPLGRAVDRRNDSGAAELEPLSVYLEAGVVPRASRDDNYNRLGADLSDYLIVEPGDVVFNKLRTWQGGFGVSKHAGIVSPAYFVCRPRWDYEPRFLHYLLRSSPYLAELTRISKFMPPSQFDILWEDLRTVPIPKIALAAQRAIADFLDSQTARIDALIIKKRRMIELLDERRDRQLDRLALPMFTAGRRSNPADVPLEDELPADWTASPIGHCLTRITYGFTNPMPTSDKGPYMLTANDIGDGCIRFDTARRTTYEAFRKLLTDKSRPRTGDILLTKDGTLGRSALFQGEDACVNQSVAVLRPDERTVEPKLLFQLLRVPAYREALVFNAGGTTIKHLYISRVVNQRLGLPPRGHQAELGRRLASLHALHRRRTTALSRSIELLQEHRQALITAAVTGELQVPGVAA